MMTYKQIHDITTLYGILQIVKPSYENHCSGLRIVHKIISTNIHSKYTLKDVIYTIYDDQKYYGMYLPSRSVGH